MTLNPARLARFTDWAQTLPPRPLPRTAIPVPGEYYLDYIARLADASHLDLAELTSALDDPAAVILDPRHRRQHQRERPGGRGWPAAGPDRPALPGRPRRLPARPRRVPPDAAPGLPPHLTACRRHRLWTGPAARAHAGQLDVSPFPEILWAQGRHLAQLRHHPPWQVQAAVSAATRATYQALRAGIWIPGQRQRLRRLAPGTWNQALASALGASPAGPDDGHLIVEIAIYPDVAWLAARSLRAHGTSDRGAS